GWRKRVAGLAGRWSCWQAWLPLGTRPPPRTAVMRASTPASSALRTPYARFVRVVGCSGCSMRFGDRDREIELRLIPLLLYPSPTLMTSVRLSGKRAGGDEQEQKGRP